MTEGVPDSLAELQERGIRLLIGDKNDPVPALVCSALLFVVRAPPALLVERCYASPRTIAATRRLDCYGGSSLVDVIKPQKQSAS